MTMPLSEHSAILIVPTDQDPPAEAIRTWIRHALNQLPTLTRLHTTLVADELVTNARRYGRPPYVLQLTVHRSHILVVAVDDSSTIDDNEPRPELTVLNGLSKRWGVERRQLARTYWAELTTDDSNDFDNFDAGLTALEREEQDGLGTRPSRPGGRSR